MMLRLERLVCERCYWLPALPLYQAFSAPFGKPFALPARPPRALRAWSIVSSAFDTLNACAMLVLSCDVIPERTTPKDT